MPEDSSLSGPVEFVEPDKAVLGKNGFIFHTFDQVLEQLCLPSTLRDDQIPRWVSLIETRHAWCNARGIRCLFAVTPEKHAVYPDCLPDGHVLCDTRAVKQIFNRLLPSVRRDCVYYDDVLRAGRARSETFYRTDIHWTEHGALLAYNELAAMSGIMPPVDIAALSSREREFTGGFSFYLKERVSEKAAFFNYKPPRKSRKVFSNSSFKEGQVEIYETEGAKEGTLVFFRDSNGTALLRYMLPHFSRAIVVASTRLFYDVLTSEKCSMVITQMAERYLARTIVSGVINLFPNDFADEGFAEATTVRFPLPRWNEADLHIDMRLGGNADAFLGAGWSNPEPHHRWAVGQESKINLPARFVATPKRIEFTVHPFIEERLRPSQRVTLFLNDIEIDAKTLAHMETFSFIVPRKLLGKPITLRICTPDATSPHELGLYEEKRCLSVMFDDIFVRTVQPR